MMTVKECYEQVGGNYEEVKKRLMDDKRIIKFLGLFMKDENFEKLCSTMEKKDYKEAFRAAHSIKGVANNMAFTEYAAVISEITEDLRAGKCTEETWKLFERAKEQYAAIAAAVGQVLEP